MSLRVGGIEPSTADPGGPAAPNPDSAAADREALGLLDALATPVLVLNPSRAVVLVNRSLRELLSAHGFAATESRVDLDALFGAGTVDGLLDTGRRQVAIGDGGLFTLRTAVEVPPQQRLRVVEWQDQSAEKVAARGFERLMAAAMTGNLSSRVSLEGLDTFLASVASSINTVVDAMQESLREVLEVQSAVASGDLTQRMCGFYSGEFATLKDAINASGAAMQRMVTQVGQVSEQIAGAAQRIRRGNDQLVSDAESLTRAMDAVASGAEEITAAVQQNAHSSTLASQLAAEAHERAARGQEVSQQALAAMKAINQSSERIAETTEIINEIAFQTNLLSLNAAVEAARVGDEGRGFALVASEVRKLAQRSAKAAKDIESMISESMERVSDGLGLVRRSSRALDEILAASEKTSSLVQKIELAGTEQKSGIEMVMRCALDVQKTLAHHKQMSEQVAEESQVADTQARALMAAIAQFTVESDDDARAEAATTTATQKSSEVSDDFFI